MDLCGRLPHVARLLPLALAAAPAQWQTLRVAPAFLAQDGDARLGGHVSQFLVG